MAKKRKAKHAPQPVATKPAMTLTTTMSVPRLFGKVFASPSFSTCKLVAKLNDGIRHTEQREIDRFRECTGSTKLPTKPVSKYFDHQPRYRQFGIYAREGVDLDRAIMAAWVGKVTALAAPLVEAAAAHVMAAAKLHADDTPVPVLAPGTGKTQSGRLCASLPPHPPYAGQR